MDISAITQITLTIIGGVTIFVAGQVIIKFYIEPVEALSKLIGEVFDSLAYYANVYSTPYQADVESEEFKNLRKEARDTIRKQGTQLLAKRNCVKLYGFASFVRLLPKEKNLLKAHSYLIGLSNSCFPKDERLVHINKMVEDMPMLLLNKKIESSDD